MAKLSLFVLPERLLGNIFLFNESDPGSIPGFQTVEFIGSSLADNFNQTQDF